MRGIADKPSKEINYGTALILIACKPAILPKLPTLACDPGLHADCAAWASRVSLWLWRLYQRSCQSQSSIDMDEHVKRCEGLAASECLCEFKKNRQWGPTVFVPGPWRKRLSYRHPYRSGARALAGIRVQGSGAAH